jgi:hypothetical protein
MARFADHFPEQQIQKAVALLASGRPYDQALGAVLGWRNVAPSSQRPV